VFVLQLLLIATAAADQATPPIDKVQNATARYIEINVALGEGFLQGTSSVRGPDFGAMDVR